MPLTKETIEAQIEDIRNQHQQLMGALSLAQQQLKMIEDQEKEPQDGQPEEATEELREQED